MPDPLLPRVPPEGLEPRAAPEAPAPGDLQWLLTLSAQGRHGDLLQAVDAAIARFPGHAALWGLKASAHFALKDHRSAVDACRQALAITPDAPEHHSNIGYALAELGDFDAAIAACRRALALKPDFSAALGNMALAQVRSGRFFEAAASARQAVALKPDDSVCWATLGTALMNIEAFDDALAAYDRSIGLDPSCAQAQTNRALLLLLLGRWTEGFPAYEWREQELPVPPPMVRGLPWAEPGGLAGRDVVLVHEQGLGDTLQFLRYAPLLAQRGARVFAAVQEGLAPLLVGHVPGIAVCRARDLPGSCHHQFRLMSLPLLLGSRPDAVPPPLPLDLPLAQRRARWKGRIGDHGFRIGVCWQGNTGLVDLGRSFPLRSFEPIAAIPGVRLISLCKGDGEAQLRDDTPPFEVEDLGPDFDRADQAFLDSAAVMGLCDLVITSDTALAHLAGTLGVPTWILLRRVPDWRWLRERADSPWYPSVRLFRQPRQGDWAAVFQAVREALLPWVARAAGGASAAPQAPAGSPRVPVSWGEVLDKISILEIKAERISAPGARANVARELAALSQVAGEGLPRSAELDALRAELRDINLGLWDVEDALRELEARQDFGPRFVALARSVYTTNDARARVKRRINELTGSALIEEKSYSDYGAGRTGEGG